MRRDLSDKLIEIHPRLFDSPEFPFRCGDGWFGLLESLLFTIRNQTARWTEVVEIKQRFVNRGEDIPNWISEYFATRPEDPYKDLRVKQVKEKFGGLRFYMDHCPRSSPVRGAVDMAETMSYRICEECGKPGKKRRSKFFVQTLCADC